MYQELGEIIIKEGMKEKESDASHVASGLASDTTTSSTRKRDSMLIVARATRLRRTRVAEIQEADRSDERRILEKTNVCIHKIVME